MPCPTTAFRTTRVTRHAFGKCFFYGGRPSDFGAGDLGDPLPSLRYVRLRACGRHARLFVGRSCDQTSIV